jgi:hypothetical protein
MRSDEYRKSSALTRDPREHDAADGDELLGQIEEGRLVSAKTIAKILDCSVSTVHRIAARGGWKKKWLGTGRNGIVRYRYQDLKYLLFRMASRPGDRAPATGIKSFSTLQRRSRSPDTGKSQARERHFEN